MATSKEAAGMATTILWVLIIETTTFEAEASSSSGAPCPNICGKAVEDAKHAQKNNFAANDDGDDDYDDDEDRAVDNDDADGNDDSYEADSEARIVNGWRAEPRPWMVLVRAADPASGDPDEDFDTCGGTVLNRRFVLTAAHCVCMAYSRHTPCSEDGAALDYDPREVIRLYVGVNDALLEQALEKGSEKRKRHEHKVDKVIVHPDWTGTGLTFPDLSLIRSARAFSFDPSGKVLPACFPPPDSVKIHGRRGYVAGWGLTRNEDCFTDNFGPERHARCRFPFLYNGLHVDACIKAETPSAKNRRCVQFEEEGNAAPDPGQSVMIEYGGKKRKRTICYHKHGGKYGWCGTCLRSASPGEYGYCPDGMPPPEEDSLVTEARPSRHWGFCSELCARQEFGASQLMETALTVLSEDDCAKFNSSQLVYRAGGVEFCAGNKMPYPDMKIYKRYKLRTRKEEGGEGGLSHSSKKKGKYIFKEVANKKNTLGARQEHYTMGYYLGQTDSCQGDSGGPFYIFENSRAYVVGVVSRGGQCAGFNQPGIYTSLLYPEWIKWIQDNIKEDNC